MGGVPSTGAETAGQHMGDREQGKGWGWRPREQRTRGVREDSPPHSCGKSEVRGPGLLGKV